MSKIILRIKRLIENIEYKIADWKFKRLSGISLAEDHVMGDVNDQQNERY